MNVYVLKLEKNKYYVGKSKCVIDRVIEHKEGKGAAWTKRFKVIDIINVYTNTDPFDEDKYVKMTMLKYGIDNVRGGSYSQIFMTDDQYDFLEKELNHSQDRCMLCGRTGHYSSDCPKPKNNHNKFMVYRSVPNSNENTEPPLECPSPPFLSKESRNRGI